MFSYVLTEYSPIGRGLTLRFSCGGRSAFKLSGKRLFEKHAVAPSDGSACSMAAPIKPLDPPGPKDRAKVDLRAAHQQRGPYLPRWHQLPLAPNPEHFRLRGRHLHRYD